MYHRYGLPDWPALARPIGTHISTDIPRSIGEPSASCSTMRGRPWTTGF